MVQVGAHLPASPTNFVGRERELAQIGRLLETTRLLTCTGAGGCGKTRLALRAASQLPAEFAEDVYWCDLAPLSDPAYVPQTLATALGILMQPGRSPLDLMTEFIGSRQLMIVLDNCEQVLEASASLAVALLMACPRVKILATSLQPLGVAQEYTWQVPPLTLPDANDSPEVWSQSDSFRLFVERAADAFPGFSLDETSAPVAASICRRLDGLPLAIELAAARVKLLTVEQIAERLDDTFNLLTRGKATALPRHQTLRATMDWTFQFLTAAEQTLLRRLSAFSGSFTLDMVEFVCGSEIAGVSALDLLTGLVDKSFVELLPRASQSQACYRLLEVIRQYAREKMEDSGEAAATRTRLLEWAVRLEEGGEAEWIGPNRAVWLDRIEVDHDNLRAALRWACTSQQVELGLRLANAVWRFWFTRGYWSEGRTWCEELLALDAASGHPGPIAPRAGILISTGTLAYRQHDLKTAVRHLEEGLALYRTIESPEVSSPLNSLAIIADEQGQHERAVRLYEEALELNRRVRNQWYIGVTLTNLGGSFLIQGEYSRAEQCLNELRTLGDIADLNAHAALNLGDLAARRGDYARAGALLQEAGSEFQRLGDRQDTAEALERLGDVARNQRDWERAEQYLHASLQISKETGAREWIARALLGLGHLARDRDQPERARELYEGSLKYSRELDNAQGIGWALNGLGVLELARGAADSAAVHFREALRQLHIARHPPEMVQVLENLAEALAQQAEAQPAARLIAASTAWREAKGAPIPPFDRVRYDRTLSSLGGALDEAAGTSGLPPVRAPTLDRVIAEVLGEGSSIVAPAAVEVQAAEPEIKIYALGPTRVVVGERVLANVDWKYAKSKELFYYLLSGSPATKAQIGLDLWPDASPEQLRSTFHRALHYSRKALGGSSWIVFEDEAYAFDRRLNYWCDLHTAEARLREAQLLFRSGPPPPAARLRAIQCLEEAAQLWRGDPFQDLDAGEWAIFRRENLRQSFLQTQLDLGRLYLAEARYADAAATFRRVLALDNYLEIAHRELMRSLARQGDTARALRHFEELRRLLRGEMGAEPSSETLLLYDRLRRGDDV
jgi:predicted ATPase/two-component SAPR family response regulator/Tfp pilus assembly protein PilF